MVTDRAVVADELTPTLALGQHDEVARADQSDDERDERADDDELTGAGVVLAPGAG